jgi:hypothetical protein
MKRCRVNLTIPLPNKKNPVLIAVGQGFKIFPVLV